MILIYLRTNDVIFAASKKTKNKFETEKIKNDLERITESIFKITYIKKKKKLYLWPIGCGVFNNNPRTILSIFAKNIRKYNYHFNEIVIIIYNKNHKDKIFNDSLIDELNFNKLNYRISWLYFCILVKIDDVSLSNRIGVCNTVSIEFNR